MIAKGVLILFGSIIAFSLYKSYHYDNLFLIFIYLLFGIPWIIIFVKAILDYKKTKNNLSTVLMGLLVFSLIVGIYAFYEAKVNSESLIKARIFGGYTDFKKNGEYVIVSGSWASRTHFYGTYKLKDSIITVDRAKFDDVLTTNRFVIRKSDSIIQEHYKDEIVKVDRFLIQIDKDGKEIKRKYNQQNYRMPILIDHVK